MFENSRFDPNAIPVPASSVIPVRGKETGEFEVYMTRRHEDLSVLGGFYVFPGGKVDDEDCEKTVHRRCARLDPDTAKAITGCSDASLAVGYWVTAVREFFEEAGVILVYDTSGSIPDFNNKETRKKFDSYRRLVQNGAMPFGEMLEKENLKLATDLLRHFSHFITPPGNWRRFDAHFFVAVVPEAQRPRFHEAEISEGFWSTPSEALDKASCGEWKMIPPTIYNLLNLKKYGRLDNLLHSLTG